MKRLNSILGLNRRDLEFIFPRNPKHLILEIAANKVNAKKLCMDDGLPVPDMLFLIKTRDDLKNIKWDQLPEMFALKPCGGGRGCGIWVAIGKHDTYWQSFSGKKLDSYDLSIRVLDILDGVHSREGRDDWAFFEERIVTTRDIIGEKTFGLPDIRIIFCDGKPALAMTRIPTKKSNGKANLHQGAIGMGIDISSGETTFAVHLGRSCFNHPDTKKPLLNRAVEGWPHILDLAYRAAKVSKLGYVGIDLVIDDRKGPLILEINAKPGLDIQIANQTGLRSRLQCADTR